MKFLVVDSGPLIKGVRLERIDADRYVTVPEVMREIRDRQARQLLSTLPVELETREPSEEAITAGVPQRRVLNMERVADLAKARVQIRSMNRPDKGRRDRLRVAG